jgi:hypothetical protein
MSRHLLDEKNQLAHPCISKIVVLICNRKVVISEPAWQMGVARKVVS